MYVYVDTLSLINITSCTCIHVNCFYMFIFIYHNSINMHEIVAVNASCG